MIKKISILLLSLLLVSCDQVPTDINDLSEIEISSIEENSNSISETIEESSFVEASVTDEISSEEGPSPSDCVDYFPFTMDLPNMQNIMLYRYNDKKNLSSYREEILALFDNLTFSHDTDYSDKFSYIDTFKITFGPEIEYLVNKDNQVLYEKNGVKYYSSIDSTAHYDINSLFTIDLDLSKAITEESINLQIIDKPTSLFISRSVADSNTALCSDEKMINKVVDIFSNFTLYKLDLSKLSEEETNKIFGIYNTSFNKSYNFSLTKGIRINVAIDLSVYIEKDGVSYYGKLSDEDYAWISYIYNKYKFWGTKI